MIFGLETLGGAQYEKEIWQNVPKITPIKFFANTFGNGIGSAKKAAQKGYKTIAIQGVWSKHNHTFGKPELAEALAACRKFASIQEQYGFKGYFSPFCEHMRSAPDMLEVMKQMKKVSKDLILVNSPNINGSLLKGYINEPHGTYKPKGLANGDWGEFMYALDGLSCEDCDIESLKQYWHAASIFWIWAPPCNGKKEAADDTAIPDRKNWPNDNMIASWLYYSGEKGPTRLPPKFLWKTHSEVHNVPNTPRENEPVLICPIKANEVTLLTLGGKEVLTLPYSAKYQDGRHMYRCPIWGYQLGEKHGLLQVKIKDETYGPINPGYRENEYRVK